VVNPENTFFSVKRFIGRRWDEVGDDSAGIPYTVKKDGGNLKVQCSNVGRDPDTRHRGPVTCARQRDARRRRVIHPPHFLRHLVS
jgi:hypothetical protein